MGEVVIGYTGVRGTGTREPAAQVAVELLAQADTNY